MNTSIVNGSIQKWHISHCVYLEHFVYRRSDTVWVTVSELPLSSGHIEKKGPHMGIDMVWGFGQANRMCMLVRVAGAV